MTAVKPEGHIYAGYLFYALLLRKGIRQKLLSLCKFLKSIDRGFLIHREGDHKIRFVNPFEGLWYYGLITAIWTFRGCSRITRHHLGRTGRTLVALYLAILIRYHKLFRCGPGHIG